MAASTAAANGSKSSRAILEQLACAESRWRRAATAATRSAYAAATTATTTAAAAASISYKCPTAASPCTTRAFKFSSSTCTASHVPLARLALFTNRVSKV